MIELIRLILLQFIIYTVYVSSVTMHKRAPGTYCWLPWIFHFAGSTNTSPPRT